MRAAHPLQTQIVGILAGVVELDPQRARLQRLPREHQGELLRADEQAGWRRRLADRHGDETDRDPDCEAHGYRRLLVHRITCGRLKPDAPGITAPASAPSHCSTSAQ